MKLLYFTDSHIRGSSPKSRKDNYFETVKNKLNEIVSLSKENKVDYILHGGDLFDRPDVSISVVNDIAPILQSFQAPIYAISGNHDIYGHNPKTLSRTMLGLLNAIGIVHNLNYKKIILEDETCKLQLSGAPFIYGIDREEHKHLYLVNEKTEGVDFAIHLVHGLLMEKKFLNNVPHTLISDIKDTKADLTISGHYHFGFPLQEVEGKLFINPGAIVRISNSNIEMKRRPKVLLIELIRNKCEIKEIFLKSAASGEDILDRTAIESHKFKRMEMLSFKESIESSSNLEKMNFIDLITEVSKNENLDKRIRDEALKRIAETQLKGDRVL